MFVTLWEFEVKPGREKQFEKVYGPEGEWAQLFRRDRNYQETRLLRDTVRNSIYLTLDFWNSQDAYEQFLETHAADYKRLDAASAGLTLRERKIVQVGETHN